MSQLGMTEISQEDADLMIKEQQLKSGAFGSNIAQAAFVSVMVDVNFTPVVLSYQDANGNNRVFHLKS
ncbi:hypothetical protein LMH73_013815 [Vibrio splendidus]|nr:hypothetical protein [Vibrio splendidus]MCC4883071.1 hypothetical protein [Vibrio splendidus]